MDIQRWLPHGLDRVSRLPLICAPFAGGGTSPFHSWRTRTARLAVAPFLLPGRERRLAEPPIRDLAALVPTLATVVEHACTREWALFGHSMGALIAYELACELRDRGARLPRHLFVSANIAPHCQLNKPPMYRMSDAELREELRNVSATPREILDSPELMALFTPTLRADLELTETYEFRDRGPLPIPMSAIGGADDPLVDPVDLTSWARYTSAAFEVVVLPGDHFFAFQDAGSRQVLAYIERKLWLAQ